ncbi:MAG: hypothetical protein ACE5HU_10335 [Acidobacteriota bacterium]
MSRYRCPDPSHGQNSVPLKSNNDRVYECPGTHKFWRREENDAVILVNLITQEKFPALQAEVPAGDRAPRPRMNFMVDVPRVKSGLDFNALRLSPQHWKLIAWIDGKANLEEVRLLAGLKADEAEKLLHDLIDEGLVEVRRSGGR